MSPDVLVYAVAVFAVGLTAVAADLRFRRIPNRLILVGFIVAFVWHWEAAEGSWAFDRFRPGAVGFAGSFLTSAALFALFYPLWLFRVLGAGDVKLIALVGAVFGARPDNWVHIPRMILFIGLAGGMLALAHLLWTGRYKKFLSNLRLIVTGLVLRVRNLPGPTFDEHSDSAGRLPYAVAVVAGAIAAVFTQFIH